MKSEKSQVSDEWRRLCLIVLVRRLRTKPRPKSVVLLVGFSPSSPTTTRQAVKPRFLLSTPQSSSVTNPRENFTKPVVPLETPKCALSGGWRAAKVSQLSRKEPLPAETTHHTKGSATQCWWVGAEPPSLAGGFSSLLV
jgi:hypothetical protein